MYRSTRSYTLGLALNLVLAACTGDTSTGNEPGGDLAGDPSSDGGTTMNGDGGTVGGPDLAGPVCTPEGAFNGAPITATAGQWTWVGVPEARCRNGSTTGFGVRLNPASDKLMIYLQGGGACFNATTCAANPNSFGSAEFSAWQLASGRAGIFDPANAANPVKDWNAIFIPYCTGDVHMGSAASADVPGLLSPKNQAFVGYANVGHYLKRIVPTFPNVSKVLLTGSSAGGFGALVNYNRVAQAFCPRETVLIDDSAPPFSDMYLAPCLQQRWRSIWNIQPALPSACTDCSGSNGGGIGNLAPFLTRTYPTRHFGLISSDQDAVISLFFGYGQNSCANIDSIALPLSGSTFQAGLADLRLNGFSGATWSTYYVPSLTHTYLGGPEFYSTTRSNIKLTDWSGGVISGAPAAQVGP